VTCVLVFVRACDERHTWVKVVRNRLVGRGLPPRTKHSSHTLDPPRESTWMQERPSLISHAARRLQSTRRWV
jgi:hypothetical protein